VQSQQFACTEGIGQQQLLQQAAVAMRQHIHETTKTLKNFLKFKQDMHKCMPLQQHQVSSHASDKEWD